MLVVLVGCLLGPLLVGGVLPFFTPAFAGLLVVAIGLLALSSMQQAGNSRLLLLLILPAILCGIQLVPLPATVVRVLSPATLNLQSHPSPQRAYFTLTLDVPATSLELARSLSMLGLGIAMMQLCSRQRLRRLFFVALPFLGLAEAAVTAVHLAQRNRSSILGLYALPSGWEYGLGTFVNRNHAASLLLLCGAVTVGLAYEHRRWRPLYLMALGIQFVTLALSQSRGALCVAMGCGVALSIVLGDGRLGAGIAGLLGVLAGGTGGLVTYLSMPDLALRIRQLWDGSLLRYEKVRVWIDTLPLCRDYWSFGVGRGAFQAVFPVYRTGDEYVQVPSPASLPLQHLSEFGLPMTLVVWSAAAWLSWQLVARWRSFGKVEMAAMIGVAAVVVHNFVDFSLELPGVAIPLIACLVAVCAASKPKDSGKQRLSNCIIGLGGFSAGVALFAGAWAEPRLLQADKQRIRQAMQAQHLKLAEGLYQWAQARHPADFNVALLGASIMALQGGAAGSTLNRVNQVLALHPADAQAHRIASWSLARTGHPSQAARELQLAFERGWVFSEATQTEAASLVGYSRLVDAVPQTPSVMLIIERYLVSRGRISEARKSGHRARVLAPVTAQ